MSNQQGNSLNCRQPDPSGVCGATRTEFTRWHLPSCGWLHKHAAKVAATHLDEEPRGDESQAAVLPVESIVVSIESEVVQIEEPGQKSNKYQDTSMDRTNMSFFLFLSLL